MTSTITAINADFESEFLHDLESFVERPIQIEPGESWNPRQTAAPERHYMLGMAAHKSVDSQVYMLRDNYAFHDIESILHISFHAVDYAECTNIHPVKEQVWLFGYKWLEKYLAFLSKSGAMKKEFYRRHNDRFLEVMGGFLVYNPSERMSFYDALRFWNPQHVLLNNGSCMPGVKPGIRAVTASTASAASVSTAAAVQLSVLPVATRAVNAVDHPIPTPPLVSNESDDALNSDDVRHSAPSAPATAAATAATAAATATAAPCGRRRLNLIRLYDSVGRTKTRKVCN